MAKNRSLQEAQRKLSQRKPVLENRIDRLLGERERLDILEVAFGEGRTLLELAAKYRHNTAKFYGVERNPRPKMNKKEDLREVAKKYHILPENQLVDFELPEVFFYDACKLHFADESMDVIYSVVAIRFFDRKAEFLEEVSRVLKPGGTAFLHIGEANWEYPYSRTCDDWLLTPTRNRFVLKYRDELIPLPTYLRLFSNKQFAFQFINYPRCVLRMKKKAPGKLDLQLTFDEKHSDWLRNFPYSRITGESQGGYRSVYELHPDRYNELFQRGFLQRDALIEDIELPEFLQEEAA